MTRRICLYRPGTYAVSTTAVIDLEGGIFDPDGGVGTDFERPGCELSQYALAQIGQSDSQDRKEKLS